MSPGRKILSRSHLRVNIKCSMGCYVTKRNLLQRSQLELCWFSGIYCDVLIGHYGWPAGVVEISIYAIYSFHHRDWLTLRLHWTNWFAKKARQPWWIFRQFLVQGRPPKNCLWSGKKTGYCNFDNINPVIAHIYCLYIHSHVQQHGLVVNKWALKVLPIEIFPSSTIYRLIMFTTLLSSESAFRLWPFPVSFSAFFFVVEFVGKLTLEMETSWKRAKVWTMSKVTRFCRSKTKNWPVSSACSVFFYIRGDRMTKFGGRYYYFVASDREIVESNGNLLGSRSPRER